LAVEAQQVLAAAQERLKIEGQKPERGKTSSPAGEYANLWEKGLRPRASRCCRASKSREVWVRYESLRIKRGQAHEGFTKPVEEERMLSGQFDSKRRELGALRPAPVMEPPSHLARLIERTQLV
jgi:hypothetical protein